MSPTMQGPHTSMKMPQLAPQRGSIVDRRADTSLANMYMQGKSVHLSRDKRKLLLLPFAFRFGRSFLRMNELSSMTSFPSFCVFHKIEQRSDGKWGEAQGKETEWKK